MHEICQSASAHRYTLRSTFYYNGSLVDIFITHVPTKSKEVTVRLQVPWFNVDIKAAVKLRRQTERKWRQTGTPDDLANFKTKRNSATYFS